MPEKFHDCLLDVDNPINIELPRGWKYLNPNQ